ncbi:MAG: serine hydrolase domain-containing protein [Rheinheimera sp.]|nr:serine hydrolase domain-containing protein [Rheinheimera sp.]
MQLICNSFSVRYRQISSAYSALFLRYSLWCLILFCLSACGGTDQTDSTSSSPSSGAILWRASDNPAFPVSTAAAEGFNESMLEQGYSAARSTPGLYAVLVLRRGRLVGEAYFNGRKSTDLLHLRSVTKTVISHLVGVAISQGKIQSLQQPISELLPQRYRNLLNSKAPVTVADLLSMRSGFAWDESTLAGFEQWVMSADPTRYVLEQAQTQLPGTEFRYNSANFHLLSVILSEQTGMATRDYARQVLFVPLGISNFRWEKLKDGYDNGGAGLELTARDLAKLGVLWQQQGRWGSQQLVNQAYVMTTASLQQPRRSTFAGLSISGYGYGWWLFKQNSQPAGQLAWGYGGQFVMTIPEQEFTLLLMANNQTTDVGPQENAVMQLATQWFLPAVQ